MGSVIRRTTSYTVNPKTGAVTSVTPVKEELVSSVPNDAPVLELPELKVPKEVTQTQTQENQLPNTGGGDSAKASALGIVSFLAGLGTASRKRKED